MSICTDNWEEVEAAAKLVLGAPIAAFIEECRRPLPLSLDAERDKLLESFQ